MRISLLLPRMTLLCVVVMIAYLSTMSEALPGGISVSDKILHVMAFLVLIGLADFSWPDTAVTKQKLLSVMSFGMLIETVQYFLPYRDFSVADMLADVVGMSLYLLMVPLLRKVPLLNMRWQG